MKRKIKHGFVSIELVITAFLVLTVGFLGIMNLSTTGSAVVNNSLTKLDDLNVFGELTEVEPEPEKVIIAQYDANGYDTRLSGLSGTITPVNHFEFVLNPEKDGYLLNYYLYNANRIVVPSTYLGLPVVGINESAFSGTTLQSIVLPNTIEFIGAFSFNINNTTTMILPNSIHSIEEWAFQGTWNLTSLTLPENLVKVGDNAFANSKLTHLEIPDTVTYLGGSSFSGTALTSVKFNGPVPTHIGTTVFQNQSNLTAGTIQVPSKYLADYQAAATAFGLNSNVFVGY